MAITLDLARQSLYKYVAPTLDAAVVTDRINQALERIYNSGKWKGLLAQVIMGQSSDPNQWWSEPPVPYVTLPRPYQTALGARFNQLPRQIYPRWQEFSAGGSGELVPGFATQKLIDMGDDFVTNIDPLLPFYPRFEITNSADNGKTIKFCAVDPFGQPIYDGSGNSWLTATLATGGVTVETAVGRITEIIKPVTDGYVNLFAVYPNDSTKKCQISDYAPTETMPRYKRYKAGGSEFTFNVILLCKRRFVPLVNGPDDNTTITPGNLGALKLVLMSLQYEDKNDLERAEQYFQKAVDLLNAELKEDIGDPVITMQLNPVGAAMRIPARY